MLKMKNYAKLTVGIVLLSSFLLPGSSIYAESVNSSDQTTDSKEIIEKALEKDSLLPTNPSVPLVQKDTASSETEQNDSTSGEKEESQKQEETIANDSNIEENNTETSSNNEELQDDQNGSVSTYSSINPRATGYDNISAPYESYNHVGLSGPVEKIHHGGVFRGIYSDGYWVLVDYLGDDPYIIINGSMNGIPTKASRTFFTNVAHRGAKSIIAQNYEYFAGAASVNLTGVFKDCKTLEYFDIRNQIKYPITSMESMFEGCTNLKEVHIGGYGVSWRNKSTANMFKNTPNLEYVDVEYWNIASVTKTNSMFDGSGIKKINLSTWYRTPTNIDMSNMFANTPNLREVDMRGFTNLDS
ncbi:BspA family leucine-rich repeat surface protein, partial [Enterococcus faecalis]|uniref:BspA family leucine-rich repeat surface protein n=1 Tax=Enterococcus faecalis TaxID=1351 RepID=UPI001A962E66